VQIERWKKVEELFEAAQKEPADHRSEFLRQACPGDAELCAEVELLLKAAESRDPLLDGWRLSSITDRLPGLKPEDRIGNFQIIELIGRGGMGEVYRARDLRLKRDVAIKTLPPGFAGDRDRIARFEREARAASALNHPNIVSVYDIGHDDGVSFIVSELVDGATLARMIQRGPLPLRKLIEVTTQICDGVAAAHSAGVIHRDLKPGNIMLTRDGRVKILDFGLARQSHLLGVDSTTMEESHPGVIMGTPGYMSPEQVRGEATDTRSDIFSLGVILYEMASGKPAFRGTSSVEVMNSTLKDEPRELPPAYPPWLDRIVRRCIEKQPSLRFQSAADLGFALNSMSALHFPGEPSRTTQPVPAERSILPWAAVTAVLTVALTIALWVLWRASRSVEQPLAQLDVDLGPEISLRPLGGSSTNSVIISPDGTRLVYVASVAGGPPKLFTRRLDQHKASELPGTEGAFFPFFSPDGKWVGFDTTRYMLSKISLEGGAAVPLGDVHLWGASWGEDGNIIASRLHGDGMVLIPSSGGAVTPVTERASGEAAHGYPQFLPGGKAVLFTVYRGPRTEVDKATIEVVSLPDRHRKILVRGGTSAHYVAGPGGAEYLIYSNKGKLFAIPFELRRLETHGTAVAVLDGVAYEPINDAAHFDVSRTGTLVYRKASGGGPEMTSQWLDSTGRGTPLLTKPGPYGDIRLSPDGKRLAVEVLTDSNQDVWVYDLHRDTMTRLTFGEGGEHLFGYVHPIWSPDGQYVVFGSYVSSMFWTRADGAAQPQQLTRKNNQTPWSFSPNGKWLAYTESWNSGSSGVQIWIVPVENSGGQLRAGKPEQFLKTQFSDCCPAFSPDGQWLAYESDESGKPEVYVRAFQPPGSGQGGQWQISNNGGDSPMWSRNSMVLLYRSGDQIMAVNYTAKGGSFVPEKARVWLSKLGGATSFDLAPDGKRLAVVLPVASLETTKPDHEVTFVFNFSDELHRRIPVAK
jgi:serine/threonine protein kinase